MNKTLLLILLLAGQMSYAQTDTLKVASDSIALFSPSDNPQLEPMTIMSPNAYAFARYVDVPVEFTSITCR